MFYTSQWKGDRFPDGRPKLPDDLLKRAASMTIEDIWGYLEAHGYRNQFEGNWLSLHDTDAKPVVGRAMTAQFMPTRPDMRAALYAEAKKEGRQMVGVSTNSWPIAELRTGDAYVAAAPGPETLIGSNLGNGVYGHTHAGFIFDGLIRDQQECREIPDFNGMYKRYEPSSPLEMSMTGINVPVQFGHAIVLPGDLVLGMPQEGVIFIPAILAEQAVSSAEFTSLTDEYNFELNRQGKNAGQFEGGWDAAKYDAFAKWIDAHPEKLKMPRSEFDQLLQQAKERASRPRRPPAR